MGNPWLSHVSSDVTRGGRAINGTDCTSEWGDTSYAEQPNEDCLFADINRWIRECDLSQACQNCFHMVVCYLHNEDFSFCLSVFHMSCTTVEDLILTCEANQLGVCRIWSPHTYLSSQYTALALRRCIVVACSVACIWTNYFYTHVLNLNHLWFVVPVHITEVNTQCILLLLIFRFLFD